MEIASGCFTSSETEDQGLGSDVNLLDAFWQDSFLGFGAM
jgi:hypothetical protein